MCDYKLSARVTLYVTRIFLTVMAALLLCCPMVVQWYHETFRELREAERFAIHFCFYGCAAPVLLALCCLDRLLSNILRSQLFIAKNVNYIRIVRWCCLAVSIICFAAAFGFPLFVFLSVIMAFLFMVVSVVAQVMKAAVVIREENDLTV